MSWWFMCLLFLAVFAMATPFNPWFSLTGNAGLSHSEAVAKIESGSLSRQVALTALGAVGIAALLFRRSRDRIEPNGVLGYVGIFFLVVSSLSVIVSDDIMFTAKRVIVLLTLTLGALAAAKRMNLREIITFSLCAGIFSLGAGFLCELACGTFTPFDGSYRFTGVMDANFQATNCSMLLLAAVASAHAAKRQQTRLLYFAMAVISFAFLVLTKSRTGMIGSVVGLLTYGGLVSPRKAVVCLLAVVYFVCAAYLISAGDLGRFGNSMLTLGRTDIGDTGENLITMTGRTNNWQTEVFPNIKGHLMLGYGYDSFWTASRVAALSEYELGSTHNGYLHTLLGLGLVGMTTYVLIRVLGIVAYFRLFKGSGNSEYCLALALLVSFSLIITSIDVQLSPLLATFVDMVLLAKIATTAGRATDRWL
jgi:hypothetical protein